MNQRIEFVKDKLLGGFRFQIQAARKRFYDLEPEEIIDDGDKVMFKFVHKNLTAEIIAETDGENVLLSFNSQIKLTRMFPGLFAAEDSVLFDITLKNYNRIVARKPENRWWRYPQFCKSVAETEIDCQDALIETNDGYIYMLPLTGDNFRCEIGEGKLRFSIGSLDYNKINGTFLCVSFDDDPYKIYEKAYRYAHDKCAIKVKLLDEKVWPEALKGFGCCTWNAFYKDLTEEKVYTKLDELREKKIPVQWLLLDDGWQSYNEDNKMTAFEPDPKKFPNGLAFCIKKIKEEYNIPYVGVWHAFNGYWDGIEPDSKLYEEQKDNLETTCRGVVVPSTDEEKAFKFWDAWHSMLKAEGVDFVKVDSQSTYPVYTEGRKSNVEYCRSNHRALERSVFKNFDGAIINCMGMDMENVLERPCSAISRNSEDFLPKREETFYTHLVQNAWNSLWHSQQYICDFDMWWSDIQPSVRCGVLRAISGGPVYVSDEVGRSNYENIRPCILADGSVPAMDIAAMPTKDILFTDCREENKFIKIWNKSGKNFACAVFACGDEHSETIKLSDIPGLDVAKEYLVYEYFSKKFVKMKGTDKFDVTMKLDDAKAYSILLIENGEVEWGDDLLYFPVSDPGRKAVYLNELI